MIIFNGEAIVVTLLAALFTLPFFGFYQYDYMSEDMFAVCMSWMVLLTSLICRGLGVVGRLFFLPMWLLSIPAPFVVTYISYGWTGIGATFGIFIGLVAFLIGLSYRSEKRRLRNLQTETITFPYKEADAEAYWLAVKSKFFSPTFTKMTPEIARFNVNVAENLQATKAELNTLDAYIQSMRNAGTTHSKIDPTVEKNLMKEIDQHIELIQQRKKFNQKIAV
ncbi:hypothetical protein IMCC3317_18350 [Kordia antarctica]|uniref:Uncharacterized protein n=1 Tax=Kordia antarctica TaxID=1218801 RepID=A0A7L4ZIK5_9FLAO|nr:hypothetical protein [Kordia antarctica]QHI36472.1 hypothetical protein IMCC3317_18350 [Kordia antarctica]